MKKNSVIRDYLFDVWKKLNLMPLLNPQPFYVWLEFGFLDFLVRSVWWYPRRHLLLLSTNIDDVSVSVEEGILMTFFHHGRIFDTKDLSVIQSYILWISWPLQILKWFPDSCLRLQGVEAFGVDLENVEFVGGVDGCHHSLVRRNSHAHTNSLEINEHLHGPLVFHDPNFFATWVYQVWKTAAVFDGTFRGGVIVDDGSFYHVSIEVVLDKGAVLRVDDWGLRLGNCWALWLESLSGILVTPAMTRPILLDGRDQSWVVGDQDLVRFIIYGFDELEAVLRYLSQVLEFSSVRRV